MKRDSQKTKLLTKRSKIDSLRQLFQALHCSHFYKKKNAESDRQSFQMNQELTRRENQSKNV